MVDINQYEPLPSGEGHEIRGVLFELVNQRIEGGRHKYGTYLKTHNGRNPIVDLLQEQIDGLQYAVQAYMESQERFDLTAWLQANREWSESVFGGGTRAEGVLKHIAKEVEEVRANPSDLEEWVDIVFLAFDGMWRQGYSPEEIVAMMQAKQAKNFARKWPAPPPQDEPSFHVSEGGE